MYRILAGLAILMLVAILVGGTAAGVLRATVKEKDEVIGRFADDRVRMERLIAWNEREGRKGRTYLLTGTQRFLDERQEAARAVDEALGALEGRLQEPEDRALLADIRTLERQVRAGVDALVERRRAGGDAEALGKVLEAEIQPFRDDLDATLRELEQRTTYRLEKAKQASSRTASRAFSTLAATIAVSLVLTGLVSFLLLRSYRQVSSGLEFQKQVLAIVGHDLRSPLSAIRGSVDHALRTADTDTPAGRALKRISRSARRIEGLARLLLDFTRARSQTGLPVVPEDVELQELSASVVSELQASHPDCEIRQEVTGPTRGLWDRDLLGQALSNLLDNALRHGAPSRPVRVRIDGSRPNRVEVEVQNEGAPIPAGMLPRIFQPFQHGGAPGKTVRASLGLGLHIVSEVAKAHHGQVEVESSSERGTTFRLKLPRTPLAWGQPVEQSA